MTISQMCEEISGELKRRDLTIRNTVTGRVVHTPEDVFHFDSHGELFHIWEWYSVLFPERIQIGADGNMTFLPHQ